MNYVHALLSDDTGQGPTTQMSSLLASRSSLHETATQRIKAQGVCNIVPDVLDSLCNVTCCKSFIDEKLALAHLAASPSRRKFAAFWEQNRTINSSSYPEISLEQNFLEILEHVLCAVQNSETEENGGSREKAPGHPQSVPIVERQRILDDKARTDLIISQVNFKEPQPGSSAKKSANKQTGRPSFLIELKAPALSNFTLERHHDQLVHYVQELLSRHVSVQTLPFALFNGHQYILGYADWPDYSRPCIELGKKVFTCQYIHPLGKYVLALQTIMLIVP